MVFPRALPSGKPSSLWKTFHQDTHTGMAYLFYYTEQTQFGKVSMQTTMTAGRSSENGVVFFPVDISPVDMMEWPTFVSQSRLTIFTWGIIKTIVFPDWVRHKSTRTMRPKGIDTFHNNKSWQGKRFMDEGMLPSDARTLHVFGSLQDRPDVC